MAGVNKVILLGNLGKDPEIRTLESGAKLARIAIATNEYFKNKSGETIERTEWHNIVLWYQKAEWAEKYYRKGNQVYVEGRLRTRQWDDKEGNRRYMTEIVADVVFLTGSRPADTGSTQTAAPDTNPAAPENLPEEDDLPF